MHEYGGKEMAEAFRTVRKNTIQIAEDIPEDQYGYRVTPDVQTVAEELAHVAASTWWAHQVHRDDKKTFITFEDFGAIMAKTAEIEQKLKTKPQIVEALRKNGEEFAHLLESLTRFEPFVTDSPSRPTLKSRLKQIPKTSPPRTHARGVIPV